MNEHNLSAAYFNEFFKLFGKILPERCISCGTCRAVRMFPLLPGEAEYSAAFEAPLHITCEAGELLVPLTADQDTLLGTLYPLVPFGTGKSLQLKIDPWCPLADEDVLRDKLETQGASVLHLLQQLPDDFLSSAEFLWNSLWDVRQLRELTKNKKQAVPRISKQDLQSYRLPSISSSEAHALYIQDASWKKLQGSLLYYIQADFPSPVCHAVRTMMESRDIQLKITSLLKATESLAQLSVNTLITHYVSLVRHEGIPETNVNLHLDILAKTRRPSFGTLVGLSRDISAEYLRQGITHFVDQLPQAWSGEVADLMGWIVSQRNRIQHNKLVLSAENSAQLFEELFESFLKIVYHLRFLRNYVIVAPVERKGETYDMWVARGIGNGPQFWQYVHPAGELSIGRVALMDMNSMRVMSLWPFYRLESGKNSTAAIIRAEYKDAKRVDYVNEIQGDHRTVVMEAEDFPAFLEPLSPDYVYQSRSYLKGFTLRELSHELICEIVTPFGDLKTSEHIHLQKIKHVYDPEPPQDRYNFDYHDSPYFPIDDETFALDILIDGEAAPPGSLIKTIWNPGFRKFGIDLGKRLELGGELHLQVSFFEPELMDLWPDDPVPEEEYDDYYEISPTLPCDRFTFTLIFPRGYVPCDVKLLSLKGETIETGKILKNLEVRTLEDGRAAVVYVLHQPTVEATYLLQYNVQRPARRPGYPLQKSLFQAGRTVYESMLQEGPSAHWKVHQENGKLIIEPAEN